MYDSTELIFCRIKSLFEIIISFPESEPALLDLKECLKYTYQFPLLISTLKSALRLVAFFVVHMFQV